MISSHIKHAWTETSLFIRNLPFRRQIVLVGILVGVASGISSYLLESLIEFFIKVGFDRIANLNYGWRIFWIVLLPAMGALMAGIIKSHFLPNSRTHGMSIVIQGIRQKEGYITGKLAWVETIASAATIAFGGSAGKEGPIVQIGAALGSWLGRKFKVSVKDLKTLVAAGAVGGLASSFSIPLGGVFFTMEVILQDFASEAFPAVVISSVTGTVTARILMGHDAFFTPLHYDFQGYSAIVWYAILGLIAAPVGTLYVRMLKYFEKIFHENKKIPSILKPALGGFLVGTLGIFFPQVLGTGSKLINSLLGGGTLGWKTPILVFAKMLATALTLGSGGSGGSLMPAIMVGALLGTSYGLGIWHLLHVSEPIGAFAVVGMGSLFATVFRAPVTAIIMTFELTQDYGMILPVMFSCILSSLVAQSASKAETSVPNEVSQEKKEDSIEP